MTLKPFCLRLSVASPSCLSALSVSGRQTKKREEIAGPAPKKNVADTLLGCDWQGALCCEKVKRGEKERRTLLGSGEIALAANYPAIKPQSIGRILLKKMSKARRNAPPLRSEIAEFSDVIKFALASQSKVAFMADQINPGNTRHFTF
jgi:hypothetical protein